MKPCLSFLLILALLCSLCLPALGATTRGVTLSSDSAFFGAFTLSKMPKVQSAVNAGNYTLAKQELLAYYTEKFKNYNPIPASANRSAMVYLASQNVFAFSENYMGSQYITTTDYKEYQFNMGTNKTTVYVLSMLNKTTGEILIPSREASSMYPQLILTLADGSTKTLKATADTYIRAGSYASSNYGSSTTLYAHHDVSGTTPYSTNSKRVYLKFDSAAIPSDVKNIKLSVYAKCSGMSSSESKLRLTVFGAYSTNWTESGLTWNWLTNNNGHAHFSWDGISGGFTWTKPSGTPNEWLNYNTRFYEVSSLVQSAVAAGASSSNYKTYLTTAKNLILDFINDAGAGKPANRSIEPANRLMEFPYIYKHLLASGLLTAEENAKLLAWVYDEAVYMNSGATLFNSSNTVLSDLAYTNHGFWHLAGFYQSFGFFPEFAKASTWRSNYNARQPKVVDALIYSDGSYNEVTFGYPSEVINWSSVLLTAMSTTGDTSAVASTFKTKLVNLAKYLVDCTMPNGTAPFWGQGGPAATKAAVNLVLNAIGNSMDDNQTVQELRYYVNHSTGTAPDTYGEYDNIKVVADRTGWDSTDSMIFMNAKSAGNHAHRDANALLFYYGGRSLLTDTGMTSYDSSHAHYSFQNSQTKSHNTIEIDSTAQTWTQNLSDAASKGNIDMVSNAGVTNIRAWTTATTNFTHYRNVSYIKGLGSFIVVTDKVVPSNSNSHTYRQNWHCAPYSNPSIASDVHDTGKTAYSSGANLIIAQAYNIHNTSLNTEITATLQTGYDSSAAATTTKYFEYKQTKSGVATYQTILYPVASGTTATVTPVKLSMVSTADDIALASRIAIEDSANPNLKVLYHYNSFESTPSTREFGGHTTDASTAMLGLNQASNGKTIFVSIANGSTLYTSNYKLLQVSAKVTDLSVRLDGTTMILESSDPNISFRTITSNLSGQTVKKVTLNGKEVAFHQDSDGTVTVGNLYFFTDFTSREPFALTSDWTARNTTVSVDTKEGLLTGTFAAKDPYVFTQPTLAYNIRSGDIVEIRIRNTITGGQYSALQFFYTTAEHTVYTESKSCRDSHSTYPADSFVVAKMNFPDDAVGQVLTALRIDPVNSNESNPAQGTFAVDYIYIGPATLAPSAQYASYTVTFKGADGSILATQTVQEGASASYMGAIPTKAYDSNYHYSFKGWDKDLSKITADTTVTAQFIPTAHSYTEKITVSPTCTAKGTKTYTCSCGRSYTEELALLAHSPVTDEGYAPTCTAEGLSDGSHCGSCGIVLEPQTILPKADHSPVTDKGYTPTCTAEGLSDGSHCGTCGTILEAQVSLPKADHSPVTVPGTPASCLNSGLSDGQVCGVCELVLAEQQPLPRLGHDYVYSDLGDSHTAHCSRCNKNLTASHSYIDGQCICGATEPTGPVILENLPIQHTLDLASDISIKYVIRAELLKDYVNPILTCTLPVYTGNDLTGTTTIELEPELKGSYYYFTLRGLTAVQMGNVVLAQLSMEKNGQSYLSAEDRYCIGQYAYAQLDKVNATNSLKTLCAELLRYGTRAQIYKNYRTDALVDSAMTEAHRAYLSPLEEVSFGNVNEILTDVQSPVITWVGKTLELNSKVCTKFVFQVSDLSMLLEELELHVNYVNYKGETKTAVVREFQVYDAASGRYSFSFDELLAAELRAELQVAIYAGDCQLSRSLRYSPAAYGKGKTGTLGELCKALFAYSDSAKAYFSA
ncbi:MAG: heparinase II/III family protein [Oscillospiraceae bacterium]|nr:heparinase II/III family protein [Oscillospiraceae bacterium]